MTAVSDDEHEEWLKDERERKETHSRTRGEASGDDGRKEPSTLLDDNEAQEEVDDASDDAADELMAEERENGDTAE